MASPSTVITFGYGSFGSVNLVPTLGFAAAEPEQITIVDAWLPIVNDRNWQWNRLPQSNWEPVVNDRNWSATNDL